MDEVFLENLVLSGRHGVHDSEQAVAQEFIVTISADLDARKAAETDDISDTANYKDFLAIARKVIEGPPARLIETVAQKIAEKILENKKVKKISVTIRKPKAVAPALAGVTIVREQS